MSKFNLIITPAIPIKLRHKISDLLEKEGYNVWSQGQFIDNSVCDINFDSSDEPKREMHGTKAKAGETNEISQ